jgi:hypothetical protein
MLKRDLNSVAVVSSGQSNVEANARCANATVPGSVGPSMIEKVDDLLRRRVLFSRARLPSRSPRRSSRLRQTGRTRHALRASLERTGPMDRAERPSRLSPRFGPRGSRPDSTRQHEGPCATGFDMVLDGVSRGTRGRLPLGRRWTAALGWTRPRPRTGGAENTQRERRYRIRVSAATRPRTPPSRGDEGRQEPVRRSPDLLRRRPDARLPRRQRTPTYCLRLRTWLDRLAARDRRRTAMRTTPRSG